MPIYEFRCLDCGTITETLIFTIAQGDSCICSNCGGNRTSRIMSRPAAAGSSAGGGRRGTGAAAVSPWPGNDDFIRLKGQQ